MNTVVHISKEGLAKLKEEFEVLKMKTIPDIAQKIDEAKQNGDLSENAEYQEAKERMAFAQGKLLELEQKITNAQIITYTASDTVEVGSTVQLKTEDGSEKTYQIVGSTEADPVAGKISNESPIGKAFMGHKVGDEVAVEKPSGTTRYTILSVQ